MGNCSACCRAGRRPGAWRRRGRGRSRGGSLAAEERLEELVAAIPDDWLARDRVIGDAAAQRQAYVRYLSRRLEAPRSNCPKMRP